jgi:hypothetical protein
VPDKIPTPGGLTQKALSGVTAVFIYIEKIEGQIFSIPIPPQSVSTRSARRWLRIFDSQPT